MNMPNTMATNATMRRIVTCGSAPAKGAAPAADGTVCADAAMFVSGSSNWQRWGI